MKNLEVVQAWSTGRVAAAGNLLTDGQKLYSYKLCIGTTVDGSKFGMRMDMAFAIIHNAKQLHSII